MRHDWIFDVLTDLHAYACRNDLPGLARKIEEAMVDFQVEVGEAECVVGRPLPVAGRRAN